MLLKELDILQYYHMQQKTRKKVKKGTVRRRCKRQTVEKTTRKENATAFSTVVSRRFATVKRLKVGEVLENAQTDRLTLFRVELDAEDVVAGDRRAEVEPVIGRRRDVGLFAGDRVIRVNEVN